MRPRLRGLSARIFLPLIMATVLALGPTFIGIGGPPEVARADQRPENDDLFDVEAYNGAREDELITRPLGDFFPAFDFSFDYTFDVDVSGGGLFGGADADVETDIQKVLTPLFSPEEQFQKNSSKADVPRAGIIVSSAGIEPGAQIAATGQPKGFRQQGNADELFYAWALDSVSLSGVVAGADSLDLPQASSPRGVHSRTPQTDEDQDGMDDDWELRYGLDPTDPSDADQDPDQDGYTNDIYANEDGEVLIVEPETSAGAPGGALTNLKEYIWGTDPTNPDTDGDGFTDGQDIAGLGQMQLALTVPPDAAINDAPVLRLTILGNGLEEFEPDAPLVKLDSSTTTLTVSDAERLDVRIETSNDNPTPGEQITLTAKLGSTDFQPGILTYTWFVNNVIQTEGSGESAFTFVYTVPETAVPGDVLLMGVSAANLETRQLAEAELEIRVGELMQLDYDPAKVEAGEELTVTATMVNDSDPTDLIFHWSLDGTELVDQSGQGKTSVTLSVPPGSGEQHSVGVDVTTPADSKPFAASQTQLIENQAAVSLVVSPESVSLGQVVTALAIPEHFAKDATLRFTWYVDDTLLEAQPTSEALEIAADEAGTHTVRVVVTSLGPGSETAEASAQFTVGDELQSSISAISERGETLASVRASIVGRPMTLGIFFGVFFAVLGIVSVLLIRRNALS